MFYKCHHGISVKSVNDGAANYRQTIHIIVMKNL